MSKLYESPLRVYLLLGLFTLWGIWAGFHLPVSLFPNSSQAKVSINISYGNLSAEQFLKDYGSFIEYDLSQIRVESSKVQDLEADYDDGSVTYLVTFEWGTKPETALKEVQNLVTALSSRWPRESRDGFSVNSYSQNQGFFAASYYSDQRSLDDLHDILNPIMKGLRAKVPDATNLFLFNPSQKTLSVSVIPEKMAAFRLRPSDIENAIEASLSSLQGGSIQTVGESLTVSIPRKTSSVADLENLSLLTPRGEKISLRDVARVALMMELNQQQAFKTSGVPSLILFAQPKIGGNIKQMSEDVKSAMDSIQGSLPPDIGSKILVNPADFINSSIRSVVKEVGIAALLAVVILFIFIGSFKNVATAAIEIPISLVLAFILMRFTDMNLNLISLGGLALSAGMNVDASVVVMENIFRHFEKVTGSLNAKERLDLVIKAVDEVKLPVIASTLASLVVFIPLILTAGLTNAILGDLAKAVVFSHMFSAVVALILVPTVRLQLLKNETNFQTHSPFEKTLRKMEAFYISSLKLFLTRASARNLGYAGVIITLVALITFVLPKLPKEIVGTPETDWLIFSVYAPTSTDIRQIDSQIEQLELQIEEKFPDVFSYTFTQIYSYKGGSIMLRLKEKKRVDEIWKNLESSFENTPTVFYSVVPWNPSELRLPDPPHMRVEITGSSAEKRELIAEELRVHLAESEIFPSVNNMPNVSRAPLIRMTPYPHLLAQAGSPWTSWDLSAYSRMANGGRRVGTLNLKDKSYDVIVRLPEERVKSIEDLKALPVGIENKVVPLSALSQIELTPRDPATYRLNLSDINLVTARLHKIDLPNLKEAQVKGAAHIEKWIKEELPKKQDAPVVQIVEPNLELQAALEQLKVALALSVLLIFVTMILQFGDVVNALLVMVAVPLGFIGVLISLFVFKSTLSLNSALGVILLNGITVANSIILVDFMKRKIEEGLSPLDAALEAGQARLRPILMTSLTTGLGMMPIALGFGEGGRILQPLGITVSGGLWFSTFLTLFIVPALQVQYMNYKLSRQSKRKSYVA